MACLKYPVLLSDVGKVITDASLIEINLRLFGTLPVTSVPFIYY